MNSLVRSDWSSIGSSVPEFEPWGVSLDDLQTMADENILFGEGSNYDKIAVGTEAEGYVIRFSNGTRCKIKLGDYLRLHKVLTGCTERTIWEVVSQGEDLYRYLENVPDEFRDWVLMVSGLLIEQHGNFMWDVKYCFSSILSQMDYDEDHLPLDREGRKEFARRAKENPWATSELFLLLDQNEKKLEEAAWKRFRPEALKPFTSEG